VQRKPTKNTRGPNAKEKRFQAFCKEHDCVWCGNPGPSIVDHVKGATKRHNKVLIGHWLVLPNCPICDHKKTIEGQKLGNYALAWEKLVEEYPNANEIPDSVIFSIADWGLSWENYCEI
jgi:hypothetical protein